MTEDERQRLIDKYLKEYLVPTYTSTTLTQETPNELEAVWPIVHSEQMIKDYMEHFVKGQQKIVDKLSFVGFSYTLQRHAQYREIQKSSMPKINMLITGPTGFGKTYIVKKFADSLCLPYKRIDCTSITGEGWRGASLSDYLKDYILENPDGFGILHLDEIDKIHSKENDRGFKSDIQNSILDLLDGRYEAKSENSSGANVSIRGIEKVNNCLVILTGSFQASRDEAQNKKLMGFKHDKESDVKDYKNKMSELGFLSEFAGRIVCSEELEKYEKEDVKKLILTGFDSSYNKYRKLYGVDKFLTDTEIDEVVDKVLASKSGLRELDSILFDKCFKKRSMR